MDRIHSKDSVTSEVLTAANTDTAVFRVLHRVAWQKFTDVSEQLAAFIIKAMYKPRAAYYSP
jgi:hypothetical protein